jgi:Spy/CpxP family protein refolding chaperone
MQYITQLESLMFSAPLNPQAVRVTTVGLITAFLAVCTVSVAPASATTSTSTKSGQHAAAGDSSGKRIAADGFHW